MQTWDSPFGPFNLGRFPYDQEQTGLQAWNAADSLMVHYLAKHFRPCLHVLILNDHCGALALGALAAGHKITWLNESYLSWLACQENLRLNDLDLTNLTRFKSFDDALLARLASVELVLMQVPKSHDSLDFQLYSLSSLPQHCSVIAGAMTRDIHKTGLALFDHHIGQSKTSLAAHKARLIFASKQNADLPTLPSKETWPKAIKLDDSAFGALETVNYSGVFSVNGHDRGSLLLAKTLVIESKHWANLPESIIDCGSGNGLLALCAARLFPKAHVVCADESWLAVCSAHDGFERNGMCSRASFVWTDCLTSDECGSANLILCNPPFHQGRTQTDAVAKRMFAQAAGRLKSGGKLLIVANRHLGYAGFLGKLFCEVLTLADDNRYVVLACSKAVPV